MNRVLAETMYTRTTTNHNLTYPRNTSPKWIMDDMDAFINVCTSTCGSNILFMSSFEPRGLWEFVRTSPDASCSFQDQPSARRALWPRKNGERTGIVSMNGVSISSTAWLPRWPSIH